MNAQQQLAGAAGVGLIVANAWTGTQRQQLAGLLAGSAGAQQGAHTALRNIGVESLFVFVLVLLAGTADSAGNAACVVLLVLWLLWAFRTFSGKSKPATSAPTGTAGAFQSRAV